MIISHVKIIAFQLSLFCKNYRFSKTVLYIINRIIHGCLEIPYLFLVLNMISHSFAALTREISCSTLEINMVFPRTMYYSLFILDILIIFLHDPSHSHRTQLNVSQLHSYMILIFLHIPITSLHDYITALLKNKDIIVRAFEDGKFSYRRRIWRNSCFRRISWLGFCQETARKTRMD